MLKRIHKERNCSFNLEKETTLRSPKRVSGPRVEQRLVFAGGASEATSGAGGAGLTGRPIWSPCLLCTLRMMLPRFPAGVSRVPVPVWPQAVSTGTGRGLGRAGSQAP